MDQQGELERNGVPSLHAAKLAGWERKLLNLESDSNSLLNMRVDLSGSIRPGGALPLVAVDLASLEDAFQTGGAFTVHAEPGLADHAGALTGTCARAFDYGQDAAAIDAAFGARTLLSPLDKEVLADSLQALAKAARVAREENGVNALFLALGLLRWYEPNGDAPNAGFAERYAPLVLLPVNLERPSVRGPFKLALRDEEVVVNAALLERMKHEPSCGVALWDPENLPSDDVGLDVSRILEQVGEAVARRNAEVPDGCTWAVCHGAYLGEYRFTQYEMWNDVHTHHDILEAHPVVRGLMESFVDWGAGALDKSGPVDVRDVLLTLPADSSQLFAIRQASSGKSFVLSGPPGTGKSQAIAAMIANAMGQKKTVLFVAEKKAALEVVKSRLDAMGLGVFCLELHSDKAARASVLGQLRAALESLEAPAKTDYAQKVEQLASVRADLDRYSRAMHDVCPCGLSLYEMISRYMAVEGSPAVEGFASDLPEDLGPGDLERLESLVCELAAAGGYLYCHPSEHPLARARMDGYSRELRARVLQLCRDYLSKLEFLGESTRAFVAGLGAEGLLGLGCPELFDTLDQVARGMFGRDHLPSSCLTQRNPLRLMGRIEAVSRRAQKLGELRASILERWDEEALEFDVEGATKSLAGKTGAARLVAICTLAKRMEPLCLAGDPLDACEEQLRQISNYQRERVRIARDMTELGIDRSWDIDWASYPDVCREALESESRLSAALGRAHAVRTPQALSETQAAGLAEAYLAAREGWKEASAALCEAVGAEEPCGPTLDAWCAERAACVSGYLRACDDMHYWSILTRKSDECREQGLGTLVEAYLGGLATDDLLPAFRRSLYQALIDRTLTQWGLDSFLGLEHENLIDRYASLDKDCRMLARREVFRRVAEQANEAVGREDVAAQATVLRKAIASAGRGMSLRSLFARIPDLLHALTPVMLLSPMSVARYLEADGPAFDLVIFDEASQISTAKAVGAIMRGKDVVVVGDPNQMPPNTLFSTDVTYDDVDPMLEDLPSILDDCLAMGMPRTQLKWHYRSRHEGLIAFSNQRFYGGGLMTFPSAEERSACVTMRFVPDALFEHGVNKVEARAMVDEVVRRANDPSECGLSVGIVTFNKAQMGHVEDLLAQEYARDPRLESWAQGFAVDGPSEPLFVKNIETVQGDERDVVLLGLTHGPDPQGRVSMNFGNLNWEGGWRRLNVAVTRARRAMEVFSSFQPEQMDSNSTSILALRDFLAYARSGSLPQQPVSAGSAAPGARDGIATRIAEMLGEGGYGTECSVGTSGFRVDVAVVDPRDPDRFLMAILLDGPQWGPSSWARDREVARPAILRSLGWNVYRAWAPDWYDNSARESSRLLAELSRLCGGHGRQDSDPGGPDANREGRGL